MKLTTKQLRSLIREEYRKALNEKNPKAPADSRAVGYQRWDPAKDDQMRAIEIPLRELALETYEEAHRWLSRWWIGGFGKRDPVGNANFGEDSLARFVADVYEASGEGEIFSKEWFAADREYQREQLSRPIREWVEQEEGRDRTEEHPWLDKLLPGQSRQDKATESVTMAYAYLGPKLDGKGGLIHTLEVLVETQRDNDREMERLDEPLR